MRFHSDGPAIPDSLLERADAGRVVFLCGAGVSLPSGMPSFIGLTRHVIEFFDPPEGTEIMSAFRPWLDDPSGVNVPLDQIFNLLHQEYGKDEVNALVTELLSASPVADEVGREHRLIKRISSNQSGAPQIVTTNFDLLFETGAHAGEIIYHVPPAFPDLAFGTTIEGITYLHGRLADVGSAHHPYVLSSADFGRAYLSEGWATNFIRNLLNRYTVVLVGYQAEDPPIKYLLQGLNHDGLYDHSRLYAFDRGLPEDVEAKWLDRGVTAIAYSDHAHLWRTMEAWADRGDDPRQWRASVIAVGRQDPKVMAPYQRGQVAHVLRSVQGARLFSEAEPLPHPEWVCVMDANVRSAKQSSGYGKDAETFDPRSAYGLDDDLENISEEDRRQGVGNDNLLVWRHGDDNPHEHHRLGGRQADGFEMVPVRLWHLITWIGKSIDSPVLAWWAIRQNGLHPRLLQQIEWRIQDAGDFHNRARHVWNLIVEHHRDPRNRQWNGDWFDLKKRIAAEGWTASLIRNFQRVSTPRVSIMPPLGLGRSKPPKGVWDDIGLTDLGQFEIKFLETYNEHVEVPDEALLQVFGILEDQIVERSRRTLNHAINGPLGMCMEALFLAVPGETQPVGSLIPNHIKIRAERLFASPGEGADHAVSVSMKRLDWLFYVDPTWAKERLIPMLAFDHPASEPAWNGFLHSGRVPRSPLAQVIKPMLLDLFPWINGFSWDRDLSNVAARWLGFMRVFHPDQPDGLTKREMRTALRSMGDESRNRFIFWLGEVGQKNENGWIELVLPFINEVWPRERRFRTSASMRAWIGLLDDTGDNFPAAYGAVKKFLVAVEANDHPFYRFTREINDEVPITVRFPETTLDLMNTVTPQVITRPPYELPKVLAIIAETNPALTSDPRYLRLIDLVERS